MHWWEWRYANHIDNTEPAHRVGTSIYAASVIMRTMQPDTFSASAARWAQAQGWDIAKDASHWRNLT